MLLTGILMLFQMLFMLVFGNYFWCTDILEVIYNPLFNFLSMITPDEWQTLGNVPLGMSWVIVSAFMYSLFFACLVTGIVKLYQSIKLKNKDTIDQLN